MKTRLGFLGSNDTMLELSSNPQKKHQYDHLHLSKRQKIFEKMNSLYLQLSHSPQSVHESVPDYRIFTPQQHIVMCYHKRRCNYYPKKHLRWRPLQQ